MHMNWQDDKQVMARQVALFPELSSREEAVLKHLHQEGPSVVDEICQASGIMISELAMVLIELEFKGLISALPGKVYASL